MMLRQMISIATPFRDQNFYNAVIFPKGIFGQCCNSPAFRQTKNSHKQKNH